MKILFDLKATQSNKADFHGGSEYAKVVYNQLLHLRKDESIIAFYSDKLKLDDGIAKLTEMHKVRLISVCNLSDIQKLLKAEKIDTFYSALPYYYHSLDVKSTKFLFTVHGIRQLEKPTDIFEYKYCKSIKDYGVYIYKQLLAKRYKRYKRKQFENLLLNAQETAKIIVPSRHTKYSLISEFPFLKQENLLVSYSPIKNLPEKERITNAAERLRLYDVKPKSFFLISSAKRWIKNAYRAIKAIDEIFSDFPEIRENVLILGADKKNSPITKGLKNPDRFIFSSYVSEDDLNLIYSEAFAFIYPTLNEGFGYPPLEAMCYGTPVLASATTSITEVCENAVLYFEPDSIAEIKTRILTILYEPGLSEIYSDKGKARYNEVKKEQVRMLDELCEVILGRC